MHGRFKVVGSAYIGADPCADVPVPNQFSHKQGGFMRYFITLAILIAFGFGFQANAQADGHDEGTNTQQVDKADKGNDDPSTATTESEEEPDCD